MNPSYRFSNILKYLRYFFAPCVNPNILKYSRYSFTLCVNPSYRLSNIMSHSSHPPHPLNPLSPPQPPHLPQPQGGSNNFHPKKFSSKKFSPKSRFHPQKIFTQKIFRIFWPHYPPIGRGAGGGEHKKFWPKIIFI